MDVVTDVLTSLRFLGTVACRVEACAPWGVRNRRNAMATFHVISRGSCWIRVAGSDTVHHLSAGDLVLLPHGDEHELLDDPASASVVLAPPAAPVTSALWSPVLRLGGSGAPTTLVCGHVRLHSERPHPLLATLPNLIRVEANRHTAPLWLDLALKHLASETHSDEPGSEAIAARLTEILFVYALRAHMTAMPPQSRSWLGALRDPQIARALAEIHRAPGHRWSLAALAKAAGHSRSLFAARFNALVGQTPMAYLTTWRMHVAARALEEEASLALVAIAERVGYESEASFARTFKKELGIAPGAYRKSRGVRALAQA
ncbi:MAG: AraC family transcriptional regulator [Luteimonas sp.]